MYDTLVMLKPDASFSVDELQALVIDVTKFGDASVEREGMRVRVTAGSGSLDIVWNNTTYVVEESNEIAERFGVSSQGCRARFEMTGDDPDMELFNYYLIINERLQKTGSFVIFDTQECKLLFE